MSVGWKERQTAERGPGFNSGSSFTIAMSSFFVVFFLNRFLLIGVSSLNR